MSPVAELAIRSRKDRYVNSTSARATKPVVFVVDHDVSVRISLERLIRSAGWEPQLVASAGEVIPRARFTAPSSCLILDACPPDLSGLELQARLIAEHSPIPVIFITGHGDIQTTVRAMKAGAV